MGVPAPDVAVAVFRFDAYNRAVLSTNLEAKK